MIGFEQYVELYSRDLSKFCIKLCGNIDDAEDLFQDTWTRALRYFKIYDEKKSFKTWLFTICVNIYKNSSKLKYNSRKIEFSTTEEKERFFSTIPSSQEDRDEYIDLLSAIAALPKKHRVVITLYYFKEFSQKEIAEILSIPEGTVSSRLTTAKKLLKRRLSDD
ncbi:MAG: RNA polymerase sigma factor [Ruminococcus sp.]|nr:RNA polymerase sigma factor [Ruminococcus sp.]